jgi:uncharacterized protein YpiB (UPF0302 family)
MLSTYRVQEIRTDVDLERRVSELMPKEGEKVQDQRFAATVEYQYRADRTRAALLNLVDEALQRRQQDAERYEQLQRPYEQLLGTIAPTLPTEGWVGVPGGERGRSPPMVNR